MAGKFLLWLGLAAVILPASAQISPANAMRSCRDAVRRDARSAAIEFRHTGIFDDEGPLYNEGTAYRVDGTFARRGERNAHTFACSVDAGTGSVNWVQIDQGAAAPPETGSADRAALSDMDVMNACREAVRRQIFDHGYTNTHFSAIGIEDSLDGMDHVFGRARGEVAGHENWYRFSCQINRMTGEIQEAQIQER